MSLFIKQGVYPLLYGLLKKIAKLRVYPLLQGPLHHWSTHTYVLKVTNVTTWLQAGNKREVTHRSFHQETILEQEHSQQSGRVGTLSFVICDIRINYIFKCYTLI